MSIFFTDLDNTMIYSYRREIGKPKIVIEHLHGKEQSFMTKFTYEFLYSADWLTIIPVTTRTEQQYHRIECSKKLRFKYAIVCNGGKLLVNGKEDTEWSHKTDTLAQNNYNYMNYSTELLSHLCSKETIHRPEKYMSYVKSDNPEYIYTKLIKLVDPNKVNVQKDGRKIYIFANNISKGMAIRRFKENMGSETILAAGDNMMDVSMLNIADIAFVNHDMFSLIVCKKMIKIEDIPFSDGICKSISEMKKKGML